MFKWLTKTKKGYTLVELMIVLVLLSLGSVALINLLQVGYRAFSKSEERYIKQEEVKRVAELLRTGAGSVASSKTADIFDDIRVVPTANKFDRSYSYLYADPQFSEKTVDGKAVKYIEGYKLYVQNRGVTGKNAKAHSISDIPIFIKMRAIEIPNGQSIKGKNDTETNACGVIITLSALENDFVYEAPKASLDGAQPPPNISSDDIYYSLDVAYHFPNMVTNEKTVVSRDFNGVRSRSRVFNAKGEYLAENGSPINPDNVTSATKYKEVEAVDKNGLVLRVYNESIISGGNTETDANVPSLCFIATASYGHDSGEVTMLREFRDKCLLTNPLGTLFVKAYYTISPPIAKFIAENETLKAAVRGMLKPVIIAAEYALNPEIRVEGIICLVIGLASLSGATITVMAVNKRRRKEKIKK